MNAHYETVIGLEVHAQLLTQTKLFCADTTGFGKAPNTQVSPVSLGYPGTLPVMNKAAITLAIRLGLATHCEIVQHNYFARKNYFYPDLPKGYQISQHTTPICRNGFLEVQVGKDTKRIRINRIHIEEDAGKSLHDEAGDYSNIDYNRAGVPLLEIVTEPDIRSGEEAAAYVTALRKLVRHLQVCDGNMEQGSLRCDVNISVRPSGDPKLGTRVEVKNLNSIRFIKKAVAYEEKRLADLHRSGQPIQQQTRGFNEGPATTYTIRTKEDEDDYRYFPEPDLPPFYITNEMIEEVRAAMPPSFEEIQKILAGKYGLSEYDAQQLSTDDELRHYFEAVTAQTTNYKAAVNWVTGPVKNHLASLDASMEDWKVPAATLASLIGLIDANKITYTVAIQKVLPALIANPLLNVEEYIRDNDLYVQSSGDELDGMIDASLVKHAAKIAEYKKGKKGLVSLFVGEVMKLSNGKADARLVTEKLLEKLNNY